MLPLTNRKASKLGIEKKHSRLFENFATLKKSKDFGSIRTTKTTITNALLFYSEPVWAHFYRIRQDLLIPRSGHRVSHVVGVAGPANRVSARAASCEAMHF